MAIKFLNQVDVSGTAYLNGANNNSGKADFAVKAIGTTTDVSLSLINGQFQVGGTDMNYEARLDVYSSNVVLRSWDRNLLFTTDSHSGSHYITFSTSNAGTETERMRITSSGKIGIGTTSPQTRLQISTSATTIIPLFTLHNSTSTNGGVAGSSIDFVNSGDATATGARIISTRVADGARSDLRFHTDRDDFAMIIDEDQNVGIGTTTPAAKLHIHNTSTTSDGDGSATQTTSGQDSILLYGHGGTNGSTYGSITWLGGGRRRAMITAVAENADTDFIGLAFYTRGTDGPGDFYESMRISKEGNVGIGTTSPSSKLDVNGAITLSGDSEHTIQRLTTSNINSASTHVTEIKGRQIDLYAYDDIWLRAGSTDDIGFEAGGSTRMFIKNDGKVGIGTTTPKAVMEINVSGATNQLLLTQGSTDHMALIAGTQGGGIIVEDDNFFAIWHQDYASRGTENSITERFRISSSGNVDISGRLDVAADIRLRGTDSLDQGVARLYVDTNDVLHIDAGNDGNNVVKFNTSGDVLIKSDAKLRTTNNTYNYIIPYRSNDASMLFRMGHPTVGRFAFLNNANTEVFTIDARNEKVGIGTTSPSYKLDVSGEVRADAYRIDLSATTQRALSSTGTDSLQIGDAGVNDIKFKNAAGNSFIIDSSGNVGIGTTSPATKLDVWSGKLRVSDSGTSQILLNSTNSGSKEIVFQNNGSVGGYVWHNSSYMGLGKGSSSNSLFVGTSGGSEGNVGIGTSSPVKKLHVEGGALFDVYKSDGTVGGLYFRQGFHGSGSYNLSITTYDQGGSGAGSMDSLDINAYDGIAFNTGSNSRNERMRIKGNGNVGIGTTGPGQVLTVQSSDESLHDTLGVYNSITRTSALNKGAAIRIGDNVDGSYSTKIATIYEGQNPSYLQPALAFYTMRNTHLKGSEVERMRIASDGDVGIGTSSPDEKLHVSGNVKASNYYVNDQVIHNGDTDTYIKFDTNRVRIYAGGTSKFDTNDSVMQQSTADLRYLQLSGGTMTGDLTVSKSSASIKAIESGGGDLRMTAGGATGYLGTYNNTTLQILQNGSPAIFVDTFRKVGIGTTSPSSKLQVNGTFRSNGISDSADALALWINGNEEVGIGTSSPTRKLDVSGTVRLKNSASELVIDNSTYSEMRYGSANYFRADGSQATVNGPIVKFRIGGSEKMRVHSNGNVGIANTNPSFPLTVSGAIKGGGKTTYTKIYSSLNTTGNAVAGLVSASNGSSALFTFTMYGNAGAYQKIVYSCWNTSGTAWKVKKVIDEGTDLFDITVNAEAATRTFTFVTRSGTANYSPTVTVEHVGYSINTTYA